MFSAGTGRVEKPETTVHVVTHSSAERHSAGPFHPESPERIRAVWNMLDSQSSVDVELHDAPVARSDQLAPHSDNYLALLKRLGESGGGVVDGDTIMAEESLESIYRAAGGAILAVDLALDGKPAFSAMRPPGHHACRERGMGFCFLNNVVVAAHSALKNHSLDRILIVDWDVHHGNGTQELVQGDARIRYVSLHQHPHYPGTGAANQTGVGNVFNVPRPPGLPAERYVTDLCDAVSKACRGWMPQLILLSAGFDGMKGDPLGGFTLEPHDYHRMTRRWMEIRCPIASVLEGGYAPERVALGVLAHLEALGGSAE